MTPRQRYALAHPIDRVDGDLGVMLQLRADRKHATGLLMRTILAVDR